MEKGAAGYPSLPLHYGLMDPGISRYLASRLPLLHVQFLGEGVAATSPPYPTSEGQPPERPGPITCTAYQLVPSFH